MTDNQGSYITTTKLEEVRLLAVAGDRSAAVYAAHRRMEDNLAKLPAVLADTARYHPTSVDPWVAVFAAVDSLCRDVELCLQLFTIGAQVERSKGLPTVAVLYEQQKKPAARLQSFAATVQSAFTCKGVTIPVPASLMLRFAEAIRPFDSSQATKWLQCSFEEMFNRETTGEGAGNNYVASGPTAVAATPAHATQEPKGVVVAMLTLLIKWRAEDGEDVLWAQRKRKELSQLVEENVLESLIRFEVESVAAVARRKQRVQKKGERQATKRQVKPTPATEALPGSAVEATVPAQGVSTLGRLRRYVNDLLATNWSQNPSRAACVIIAIILLCILARKALCTVSLFGGFAGGTPRGGRKLIDL
ncbi:hypothetical protein, conserved [Trypanosoma brucei brucei TREU927]|uniref:Uncharacterized protein n=1 Tax=Trypanosoma brucei brucei (strain 927/4 GUTat10.1) TaxID=185431 RepID=Q38C56_TRYB2|nr:hypothetical protein, conserved [Trypanosoma brucei brucei TREU927]EAN77614.1 hypothetical protein, conserved [Trypanosoma brucei brucei TREU927]